jgi:hypothetical protein
VLYETIAVAPFGTEFCRQKFELSASKQHLNIVTARTKHSVAKNVIGQKATMTHSSNLITDRAFFNAAFAGRANEFA